MFLSVIRCPIGEYNNIMLYDRYVVKLYKVVKNYNSITLQVLKVQKHGIILSAERFKLIQI